jgi:hypothetical protein
MKSGKRKYPAVMAADIAATARIEELTSFFVAEPLADRSDKTGKRTIAIDEDA